MTRNLILTAVFAFLLGVAIAAFVGGRYTFLFAGDATIARGDYWTGQVCYAPPGPSMILRCTR